MEFPPGAHLMPVHTLLAVSSRLVSGAMPQLSGAKASVAASDNLAAAPTKPLLTRKEETLLATPLAPVEAGLHRAHHPQRLRLSERSYRDTQPARPSFSKALSTRVAAAPAPCAFILWSGQMADANSLAATGPGCARPNSSALRLHSSRGTREMPAQRLFTAGSLQWRRDEARLQRLLQNKANQLRNRHPGEH